MLGWFEDALMSSSAFPSKPGRRTAKRATNHPARA